MDIFSHALWAAAAYKGLSRKKESNKKSRWKMIWAGFWGVFPDFFAFTIPFIWSAWAIFSGTIDFSQLPSPNELEPMAQETLPAFGLAHSLYNFSHSLIVFLLVWILVFILSKRPIWVMGGWLLHIFIDIPTHSAEFYPTPLFWPISHWSFDGFLWSNPWFLFINYLGLAVVYFLIFKVPIIKFFKKRI